MADSDLYQHALSTESVHNISSFHSNYFNYISSNNCNNNHKKGSLTASATSSTTNSCTSISSLSTISTSNVSTNDDHEDDHYQFANKDINWSIEGGLQRALVVSFSINEDEHITDDKYASLYNNNDECNNMESKPIKTYSFESWMNDLRNQPQQRINRSRYRNKKYRQRKANKLILHPSMNTEISLKLNRLRPILPNNPHKLRKDIKSKQTEINNDTKNENMEDDQHQMMNINQIEYIQHRILILQNRLNDIRNLERMEVELSNWKQFKSYWLEWRLCDLFEYIQRINDRKFAKKRQYTILNNFELFYVEWMNIYQKDQHLRYKSHIFIGKNLCSFDHNDLIQFGITLKEDRREILMNIQRLNGFRDNMINENQ